jgi:hypothetical protein
MRDARAGASPAVVTRFERLSVSSPQLESQRHPFVTARRKRWLSSHSLFPGFGHDPIQVFAHAAKETFPAATPRRSLGLQEAGSSRSVNRSPSALIISPWIRPGATRRCSPPGNSELTSKAIRRKKPRIQTRKTNETCETPFHQNRIYRHRFVSLEVLIHQ